MIMARQNTRTGRHRQPLEIMASVNITNLLDTAFILLITFMLITPTLTHGLKLDLPEVRAPALPTDPRNALLISIERPREGETEERITLENRWVTLEEIHDIVKQEIALRPEIGVILEGDRNARLGISVQVIDAVKRAGCDKIAIKTEAPASENRNP